MTKAVKIIPREVSEIVDFRNDKDFVKYEFDGYALETPVVWFRREYCLTIFVLAGADERDGYNDLATKIFNRLYGELDHTTNEYMDPVQKIYGPVYICNEDADGQADFDFTDWCYLLKKLDI